MSGFLVGSGIIDPAIKRYDGGGSSFTMDNSGSTNGTLLWVGGVAQVPGTDYNVSGTTISTTSSTPSGTNNVVSLQLFNTGTVNTPADNSVDGTKTKDALIADYSDVTITAADLIMYGDATDSNNTKRDTVQGILDLGGGAWNLIGTSAASDSASLTVTGLDSTYDTYAVALSDMHPASDGVHPYLRLGDSSGVDSGGSDYAWSGSENVTDDSVETYGEDISDSEIHMNRNNNTIGTAAGEGYGAIAYIHNPGDGVVFPMVTGQFIGFNTGGVAWQGSFGGARLSVITVDRVNFSFSSGNVATGRMTVWGLAHA